MNSTLISTYLSVAKTKNINVTACELNQAPSTISKRIKRLEQLAGVEFFTRGHGAKALTLTPEGERFMSLAENWLFFSEELTSFKHSTSLDLSIAAVASLNSSILGVVYRQLLQDNVPVTLQINSYLFREMYSFVAERKYDVGFSRYPFVHPSVSVQQLYSEPIVGVRKAKKSHWLPTPVPINSLEAHNEIYAPWEDSLQEWRKTYFGRSGSPAMTVYPISCLMQMLIDERYWAIVPQSLAVCAAEKEPLCIFEFDHAPPHLACYFLQHKIPTVRSTNALGLFMPYLNRILDKYFGPDRNGESAYIENFKKKGILE